jgi:hypothetical protein
MHAASGDDDIQRVGAILVIARSGGDDGGDAMVAIAMPAAMATPAVTQRG